MGLSLSVVVLPLCVILAYKRIPLKDLRLNGAIWFVPFTFSNYMDFHDSAEGLQLIVALALMGAIYVMALLIGDYAERWLASRRER